jgi:hypothetical protein
MTRQGVSRASVIICFVLEENNLLAQILNQCKIEDAVKLLSTCKWLLLSSMEWCQTTIHGYIIEGNQFNHELSLFREQIPSPTRALERERIFGKWAINVATIHRLNILMCLVAFWRMLSVKKSFRSKLPDHLVFDFDTYNNISSDYLMLKRQIEITNLLKKYVAS